MITFALTSSNRFGPVRLLGPRLWLAGLVGPIQGCLRAECDLKVNYPRVSVCVADSSRKIAFQGAFFCLWRRPQRYPSKSTRCCSLFRRCLSISEILIRPCWFDLPQCPVEDRSQSSLLAKLIGVGVVAFRNPYKIDETEQEMVQTIVMWDITCLENMRSGRLRANMWMKISEFACGASPQKGAMRLCFGRCRYHRSLCSGGLRGDVTRVRAPT